MNFKVLAVFDIKIILAELKPLKANTLHTILKKEKSQNQIDLHSIK